MLPSCGHPLKALILPAPGVRVSCPLSHNRVPPRRARRPCTQDGRHATMQARGLHALHHYIASQPQAIPTPRGLWVPRSAPSPSDACLCLVNSTTGNHARYPMGANPRLQRQLVRDEVLAAWPGVSTPWPIFVWVVGPCRTVPFGHLAWARGGRRKRCWAIWYGTSQRRLTCHGTGDTLTHKRHRTSRGTRSTAAPRIGHSGALRRAVTAAGAAVLRQGAVGLCTLWKEMLSYPEATMASQQQAASASMVWAEQEACDTWAPVHRQYEPSRMIQAR